jgi:hypothetical protein
VHRQEATRTAKNLIDISPIYVISPVCFHLNHLGNGNDDILSEEHFEHVPYSAN